MLHNKVENRVACPEYARNSREADPSRDSRRDIYVSSSLVFPLSPCAPFLLARDRIACGDPRPRWSGGDFGILSDRAAIENRFCGAACNVPRASERILKRNELVSRIGGRGVIENQMGDRAAIARAFEAGPRDPPGAADHRMIWRLLTPGFDCFRKRHDRNFVRHFSMRPNEIRPIRAALVALAAKYSAGVKGVR